VVGTLTMCCPRLGWPDSQGTGRPDLEITRRLESAFENGYQFLIWLAQILVHERLDSSIHSDAGPIVIRGGRDPLLRHHLSDGRSGPKTLLCRSDGIRSPPDVKLTAAQMKQMRLSKRIRCPRADLDTQKVWRGVRAKNSRGSSPDEVLGKPRIHSMGLRCTRGWQRRQIETWIPGNLRYESRNESGSGSCRCKQPRGCKAQTSMTTSKTFAGATSPAATSPTGVTRLISFNDSRLKVEIRVAACSGRSSKSTAAGPDETEACKTRSPGVRGVERIQS